ncbi:hypothetical protein MB02_14180 [Croceicoccus estronivorus]|uniref:O-antigen ligase family protein n=1 Tax=Croceicoccus estronivorus TaxID=1172626 RepID=UPI00082FE7BF|nr:O-antigen ligase family protein [Croceicoccus estronivorus]OCC22912.1 hypothetical protein MB02_14180 [Croceicoccus estronivorus]
MTPAQAWSKIEAHSGAFWGLSLLLLAVFAMGGSARGDVASLMFLRPLAVLLLGFGLSRLSPAHLRAHPFLFAMAAAILGLLAIQLIPLPPAVWSQLPGREIVTEIESAAGSIGIWRPASLTPDATRNAFFAALVPTAALVLGVQLDARERRHLLPVVLTLGGISALLGLMQLLGNPRGPLYLYDITNNGVAVGLFANRNHQALLLAMMVGLLAVFGCRARFGSRQFMALLLGMLLLPLILITGSRSGLVCGIVALVCTPFLLLHPADTSGDNRRRFPAISPGMLMVAAAALFALTIWLGRALAWNRLLASGPEDELRFATLPILKAMILAYFPVGTGAGSFPQVYQMHEPDALLAPFYLNHAHSDWLEILVDGGLLAALGLLLAIAAFIWRVRQVGGGMYAADRTAQFNRLGLAMIFLAAIASGGDYPLRTPLLSCIFVVSLLWATCPGTMPRPAAHAPKTS